MTADETSVVEVDDQDFPTVTMGQAAQLLEVRPAFLRSLDAAGVLTPQRSEGGHRRYSRRQLALAARLRELFDEGMTLEAATRIVALQDELTLAREQLGAARDQLGISQARELAAARDQLAVARARVADLEARNDPRPTPAPEDRPASETNTPAARGCRCAVPRADGPMWGSRVGS